MNNERYSRRKVILLGAAGVAGALAFSHYDSNTDDANPFELASVVSIQPDLKRLTSENSRHTTEIRQAARRFMAIEVAPKGRASIRANFENDMFSRLESRKASAADIIYALESAGTIDGRGWGMQLLWQQRQKGELSKYGIHPLDEKRIKWATDNEIDPRMLAISREAIHPSYELLKAAPDLFFEAIPAAERAKLEIADTLPNPGVVAKLNMTETGHENPKNNMENRFWGYVFIGGSTAWKELNLSSNWFPEGRNHLKKIADRLQKQTDLPYLDNVEKIPGSERGNPILNGSGGAIGPQFMPINALLFMDWYKIANERLGNKYPPANPFDPFTGTIMCNLYLASEFYGRHGDITNKSTIVRPGYRTTNTDEEKVASLMKWNPSFQARLSLDTGYDYFHKVGRI